MPVLALAATTIIVAGALTTAAPVAAAGWLPPVAGEATRLFDPGRHPFEAGRHRGVDLAAAPGAQVRAPCAGVIAFAGRVGTTGRVVTLRCGPWRVTHLPLATIAARPGQSVDRGTPLGTVARSTDHAGLHLGVRREGRRFGYVDPLDFLTTRPTPAPPPLGRAPRPHRSTPPPRPRPGSIRVPARRVDLNPEPARRVAAGSNRGLRAPFAPWPAWLGLALVLAGAGVGLRRRRSGARRRVAAVGTLTR